MEELFIALFDKLPPTELFNLAVFVGFAYLFKVVFTKFAAMMNDRAKTAEKRDKQSLQNKQAFETYVVEHRHEHNQVDNRLNHMNSELVEIRKDMTAVRDSQIRVETKLDILVENKFRNNKNEKN